MTKPLEYTSPSECVGEGAPTARQSIADLLPELVGYFLRRLANPEDSADAAADTLVALFKRGSRLPKDPTELRKYAYGVARNVLAKARRHQLIHVGLLSDIRGELLTQENLFDHPEDTALTNAVAKLAKKDQELLLMVSWEGFSVAEAGAVLGLKPDAARKRYSRLRKTLQIELRK